MKDQVEIPGGGWIRLLRVDGTELDIVNAARQSYGEESAELTARDERLLQYLMDNKHTSPFEMVGLVVQVHCPLFVARQWVRHRTFSLNEVSRRYTEEDITFWEPHWKDVRGGNVGHNKQAGVGQLEESVARVQASAFENNAMYCKSRYKMALSAGVCREQARAMLPQNMMTTFTARVDLHNLLHFCGLRASSHAQKEIRDYADALIDFASYAWPNVLERWLAWREVWEAIIDAGNRFRRAGMPLGVLAKAIRCVPAEK